MARAVAGVGVSVGGTRGVSVGIGVDVLEGPPPPHRWAERDPIAAARLTRCRQIVVGMAEKHNLPPENLISPDFIRRLAWSPPDEISQRTVGDTLLGFGARNWQVGLLAADLAEVLPEPD